MVLTRDEIYSRMIVYQELIDHLDMEIYENTVEQKQGKIIQRQLIDMLDTFKTIYLDWNV